MSRREESNDRRSRYASVKKWVEKQGSGSAASYLRVPKGMSIFQPKVGIMLVDILPYEVGKGNPMAEEGSLYWERTFFVHRGIGPNQEMVICPARTLNEPCPICEYRSRLSRSEDDEDIKEASALNTKERQVFNVINRKEPDKGVQLWTTSFHTFGKELQAELMNADEQDHWELFFTLDQGFTLKIGFGEDSMGRNKFITADTIHFKDRKPLDEKDILDQVAILDDILIIKSYDELDKLFTQSQGKEKDDEPRGRSRGRSREADEPEEPRGRRAADPDLEPEPETRGRSRRGAEEPEPEERRSSRTRDVIEDEPRGRRGSREELPPEAEPDEPRGRSRRDDPEPEAEPRGRRTREEPEPEPRGKAKDDWEAERTPRGRRDDPEPEPETRGARRELREEPEPEARGKGKPKEKAKEEGAVDDGWDNFDKEPRRSRRDDPEPEPEPRGRSRRDEPEPEERPRVRSDEAADKGRTRARR